MRQGFQPRGIAKDAGDRQVINYAKLLRTQGAVPSNDLSTCPKDRRARGGRHSAATPASTAVWLSVRIRRTDGAHAVTIGGGTGLDEAV